MAEQKILTVGNKSGGDEYYCSIVRIGELMPIENSDFLAVTNVNNTPIVVRKDDVRAGDVMFYAPIGSALCDGFLRVNNMYELSQRQLNANAAEVEPIMEEYRAVLEKDGKEAAEPIRLKARALVGLFDKYGQVKQVKLKGIISSGFLFRKEDMVNYAPEVADLDLNGLVGKDFDTVNGENFIKGFIPPMKEEHHTGSGKRGNFHRESRIIGNGLVRHYDTNLLNKPVHLECVHPEDVICVTTKVHGTSIIIGNTDVKAPKWGGLYAKAYFKGWLPQWSKKPRFDHDVLYSTRNHIVNKDINPAVNEMVGKSKVMSKYYKYYELLKDVIPYGMTIYGEIAGYLTGERGKCIQKNYDYGCKPGVNRLMIYRITQLEDGKLREFNMSEVLDFHDRLIAAWPEIEKDIMPLDLLYYGKAKDMYPELEPGEGWSLRFLNALRTDKVRLHMEENDPLCKNKVPREGIVVRIDDDIHSRAFKVKCQKFLGLEMKDIENGTYEDAEAYDAQMDEDGEA